MSKKDPSSRQDHAIARPCGPFKPRPNPPRPVSDTGRGSWRTCPGVRRVSRAFSSSSVSSARHGELEVRLLRVLELRVREASQATGRRRSPSGSPARATSAASWSGPDGRRCDVPDTSRIDSSASSRSRGVERDRLDPPEALPLDVDVLLTREALARVSARARAGARASPRSRCRWSRAAPPSRRRR